MALIILSLWAEREHNHEKLGLLDRWADNKASRDEGTYTSSPHSQDTRRTEVSGSEKEPKLYGQMIGCYPNGKDRFGGTIDEDWSQTISGYESHAELFNLNRRQKVLFLSVIFKGTPEISIKVNLR